MAAVLETRLHQAQAEPMAPIDLISCLVSDELTRRSDRLLERRRKAAGFRDLHTLDTFDFNFNKKMNRSLVFDLATATLSPATKMRCFSVRLAPASQDRAGREEWPVRPQMMSRSRRTEQSTRRDLTFDVGAREPPFSF